MAPDVLLAAARFVHNATLMALWGASAYLVLLVPSKLAQRIAAKLTAPRLVASILALLSATASLPLQTAAIGDGWSDAVSRQMLWDVVVSTNLGTPWLAQTLVAALLVALQAFTPRQRPAATTIVSAIGLACLALSGHANVGDLWHGIAHPLNDALHVLSAGAWVGALVPFLLIMNVGKTSFDTDAVTALRRFSNAGHVVVTLAVLSGIVNSYFIVGSPIGWSSPYRVLLTLKIACVSAMIALAVANRYLFLPRFRRARMSALQAIWTGTVFEIALALITITLVSIFGLLDPNP
ncbi:copper homeostasis membrane protein CopD [Mesorhizobium sp. 128a]